MVSQLIRCISKGTRFNQIYVQKNEMGFEAGKTVVITPVTELISKEVPMYEYNVKLSPLKKEIAKKIFEFIDEYGGYENIIITGSFLEDGFNFEDIDIVIIDGKINKEKIENLIKQIGINPHLIVIDSESLQKGIRKDPLFRLMVHKYVAIKRSIFRKDKTINYKLLDIHLFKSKNLIDAYEILSIKERKKLLRDFISIKLFAEDKEVTIENIAKETNSLFGKDVITGIFEYADNESKKEFISKLKKELNKLQTKLIDNAAKQSRVN